ncbi:MAG: hypothetical protein NC548_11445 [Lachnospiraceae bacterium]|nr:hypothetical protein [Lachnospiraceae bacterium]MCM1234720.1 hypothetical protein [Ruminococcus flavefaciens]
MSNDLPGKFIGILIAFFLAVVVPFVNTTVEQEMLDRRSIIMDITNFIDEVVDSRQITDAAIRELNTSLASYGTSVDYTITHYRRTVNPDPMQAGHYYTNYIIVDETEDWEKGDRISVTVQSIGYSTTESIAHKLVGMFVPDLDRTLAARIR